MADDTNGVDGKDVTDGKNCAIIVATGIGSTALVSNISLIAWSLFKKKRLF